MSAGQVEKDMDVHPKYPKWIPTWLRTGWLLSRKINRFFSDVLGEVDTEKLLAVEGHTTHRQCATLFYLVYTLPRPGRIVEIGSFKGKSTVWMAKALELTSRKERVLAVDPHVNTGQRDVVPAYGQKSSYDDFMDNVAELGLTEWVEPVRSTSEEAAKLWNQPIRLLFIDGSHRYEDVLTDLRLWEPWVNVGGVICMHDTKPYGPRKAVWQAMHDYIEASNRFKELLKLKNMAVFEKLLST